MGGDGETDDNDWSERSRSDSDSESEDHHPSLARRRCISGPSDNRETLVQGLDSTAHTTAGTLSGPNAKPEHLVYYNHREVGMNVLNQMIRRMHVTVFCNLLQLAAINA